LLKKLTTIAGEIPATFAAAIKIKKQELSSQRKRKSLESIIHLAG